MGRSTLLFTLVLPLQLFGSGLSSSTLMLVAFVFTLLQESQDKFEVKIHEAKCKAVMHCDTVEIVTLERIYCYLYSLARDMFIPLDCNRL